MPKFHPGEVVHLLHRQEGKLCILSARVNYSLTYPDGLIVYFLSGWCGRHEEDELHATFDNAMAELRKQAH